MPVALSYPGVYIEEIPSGVRTITGVPTSVTAFVGYTVKGPIDTATQIFNFADFERSFGGLHSESEVGYAVQHFFLNGGSQAWIVRVANGAAKAAIDLKNNVTGGVVALTIRAKSEGVWGNQLRVDVDYDTISPASLFNLTVTEMVDRGGVLQPARSEVYRNLSMSSFSPTYAVNTINAGSDLIKIERSASAATAVVNKKAVSTSGIIIASDLAALDNDHRRLAITLDGDGPHEFDIFAVGGGLTGTTDDDKLDNLAGLIQTAASATGHPAFSAFTCVRTGTIGASGSTAQIVCTAGTSAGQGERSFIRIGNAGQRNAAAILKMGLANGGREAEGAASARPAQTGTAGTDSSSLSFASLAAPAKVKVTLHRGTAADPALSIDVWDAAGKPTNLQALADRLAAALAGSPKEELNQARVTLVNSALRVAAGGADPNVRLEFTNESATDTTATVIGLAGGTENIARYAPGVGLTSQAQSGALPGNDGTPPQANDLKGSRAAKSGIYALEDTDIFNILTIPDQSEPSLLADALAYAAERRAFFIIDMPDTVDTLTEAKTWLATNGSLRHKNAAIYFPRIKLADPLDGNRLRSFANSGAIAGLYSRIDGERGVWKAPAGTEAALRGVQALDYVLTDPENGVLNPLAINGLRNFPAFGPVVWGARTLDGSDQAASEWKYIPVRRVALFIEESLYRGTQWVVFEPNDEPLWAQIRLNLGAFMNNLFRQGAFQGKTPREAYFVKCDKETTTQNDINLGIVNIIVGFAPLKPAEFVVIKIQQIAGQIAT
jgi:phage tail sheath protein FI